MDSEKKGTSHIKCVPWRLRNHHTSYHSELCSLCAAMGDWWSTERARGAEIMCKYLSCRWRFSRSQSEGSECVRACRTPLWQSTEFCPFPEDSPSTLWLHGNQAVSHGLGIFPQVTHLPPVSYKDLFFPLPNTALNKTIFFFSGISTSPISLPLILELLKPATSQWEPLKYAHCPNCPWFTFSPHLHLFRGMQSRHQIQSALLISEPDPALFFFNTKSCVKFVCSLLFISCGPGPSACGYLYLTCYYALTIYVLHPSQAT